MLFVMLSQEVHYKMPMLPLDEAVLMTARIYEEVRFPKFQKEMQMQIL